VGGRLPLQRPGRRAERRVLQRDPPGVEPTEEPADPLLTLSDQPPVLIVEEMSYLAATSISTSCPSSRSTARTVPSGSSTATFSPSVSHPGCALAGQLGAVANQSPELLQETGAVGPQLLGNELAWQLRLRLRRRLSSLARVQTLLPTSLWKLWKLACGTAVAPTEDLIWRDGGLYDERPPGGMARTGELRAILGKSGKVLRRKSIRLCPCCALRGRFQEGAAACFRNDPARSTLRGRTAGRV